MSILPLDCELPQTPGRLIYDFDRAVSLLGGKADCSVSTTLKVAIDITARYGSDLAQRYARSGPLLQPPEHGLYDYRARELIDFVLNAAPEADIAATMLADHVPGAQFHRAELTRWAMSVGLLTGGGATRPVRHVKLVEVQFWTCDTVGHEHRTEEAALTCNARKNKATAWHAANAAKPVWSSEMLPALHAEFLAGSTKAALARKYGRSPAWVSHQLYLAERAENLGNGQDHSRSHSVKPGQEVMVREAFSAKTATALMSSDITSLSILTRMSKRAVRELVGIGPKKMNEILEVLCRHGMSLANE